MGACFSLYPPPFSGLCLVCRCPRLGLCALLCLTVSWWRGLAVRRGAVRCGALPRKLPRLTARLYPLLPAVPQSPIQQIPQRPPPLSPPRAPTCPKSAQTRRREQARNTRQHASTTAELTESSSLSRCRVGVWAGSDSAHHSTARHGMEPALPAGLAQQVGDPLARPQPLGLPAELSPGPGPLAHCAGPREARPCVANKQSHSQRLVDLTNISYLWSASRALRGTCGGLVRAPYPVSPQTSPHGKTCLARCRAPRRWRASHFGKQSAHSQAGNRAAELIAK